MPVGELLTRVTIWIALGGYMVYVASSLRNRGRLSSTPIARWAWTVGCVFYLAHVATAFHFYHGWSHSAAYLKTAKQSADTVGLNWGGGLYVSYAFTLAWLIDVVWWWCHPRSYQLRASYLVTVWQGFFFFIVFNGTVVFETGLARWLGSALCFGLAILWWQRKRATSDR